MARLRRWLVRLGVGYLAIGVVLAASSGEFRHFRRLAADWIAGLEEPLPFAGHRVTEIHVAADGMFLDLDIAFERADGRRYATRARTSSPLPFGRWSDIAVVPLEAPEVVQDEIEAAAFAFPVASDGTVSDEPAPLAAERDDLLQMAVYSARNGRWYAAAIGRAGPAAEHLASALPAYEIGLPIGTTFDLEPPITSASRWKRRLAAVAAVPAGFLADALTWPYQLFLLWFGWMFRGGPMIC